MRENEARRRKQEQGQGGPGVQGSRAPDVYAGASAHCGNVEGIPSRRVPRYYVLNERQCSARLASVSFTALYNIQRLCSLDRTLGTPSPRSALPASVHSAAPYVCWRPRSRVGCTSQSGTEELPQQGSSVLVIHQRRAVMSMSMSMSTDSPSASDRNIATLYGATVLTLRSTAAEAVGKREH